MYKVIVGASKTSKIGSEAIQWWINAPYSHVYIRWHLATQDREIVYHASHGMVHFREYNNFKKENIIVCEFELELSEAQFKKFSQKCIDLAGESYSKLELLQIILCDITNGKIHTEDQVGYICSELLCELLEDLGYIFNKPKYLITPKDIIEKLKEI